MKIAMMVRGYIPSPRPSDIVYAPIDLAVVIAEGLARRGHQLDFYGPAGTRLKVPVKTRGLRSLVHNYVEFQSLLTSVDLLMHYVPSLWDQYLSSEMFERAKAGQYDLLHFHHPETAMTYARLYPDVPVAYTLHDPIYEWYQELFHLYHSPNQNYISISNNQQRSAPEMPFAGTAYNGISLNKFRYSDTADNYLLYVGRVVPQKGIKTAIDVAEATNHRLIIIGPTYDDTRYYFDRFIKPRLNNRIKYLGYLDHAKLAPYFRRAKAFLNPIQWEEPFGVTMLEAMACGTPVIAYDRGSVPEIVVDGQTGFIVKNKKQMIEAVEAVDQISRRACRDHVEANFSNEKMIDRYEAIFSQIVNDQKHKHLAGHLRLPKLHTTNWVKPRVKRRP